MVGRMNDGRRFEDRVAIVAGGSGVLGGACARALAREGAKVALSYRGGEEVAAENLRQIEAAGGPATWPHST